jgi:maltooligosyltrehalose trehalohydrolase
MPIGAEVQREGGVHFRVWAPKRKLAEVIQEDAEEARVASVLEPEGDGYFSGLVPSCKAGSKYRFRLDGGPSRFPDPASRFQPSGVHGPSQVIEADTFHWTDSQWPGIAQKGQVIYELHIGTFTSGGTWKTAMAELPELAALGVTLLELMPVADFPGQFGWGYDGVNLFAPTRIYGTPDDFREFVNQAHAHGLGVILDVVYNHVGPDGNYFKEFSEDYFSNCYKNEWGEAINFDGDGSGPVREFFIANAAYWIDEFHIDGLRLDATQQIFDRSSDHILAAIRRGVHAAGKNRSTFVVAENEPQDANLVRPAVEGGRGIDAVWNDDFHHSAKVALTAHNEAYYTDYHGTPQELLSTIKWGFLYQGQRFKWQKQRRGTPALDLSPSAFIIFLQNHDQIANSARGQRVHELTSPGRLRALTALLLLAPETPMLFQGQEFAASAPFLYFADHKSELGKLVRKGRSEFLAQFPSIALPESQASLADPGDPQTFTCCKLDFKQRQDHAAIYDLHRDLLRLRREDAVFRSQRHRGVDGAVLSPTAFVLRYFGERAGDRLLVINLGRDLHLDPAPEPLLAPGANSVWEIAWSSESHAYGGNGTPAVETEEGWRIPGEAAIVLRFHAEIYQ